MKKILQKPLVLFLMIAIGALGAVWMVKSRVPVKHDGTSLASRPVEVITAENVPFRARALAYGNVEPAISFRSKAEVGGKIGYVHPDLKRGNSIAAGTVVVRIDPADYEVTLRQTQADLAASRSALTQLQEEEKTTRQSLALAKQNLQVGETELQRAQQMFHKRLVPPSSVDQEEQIVLQLRQQVAELQGQLNTYASRTASVKAQIERSQQQVKGQQTTLGRTEIKMPFTARIGEVSIENGEFVSVGNTLFEASDINGVEINAQLPVMHMRNLVSHLDGQTIETQQAGNIQNVLQSLNLTARVRLVGGPELAVWEARVLRFGESIDPTRRTVSVVIGVDKPYEQVILGKRPPLLKGMYTAVELYAPLRHAIVIPRHAIHQGRVYVANAENQLEIKPVLVRFRQGDLAIIDAGLHAGERVIINDLIPVIEAMPLTPELAETAMKKLHQHAAGVIAP